MATQTYEIIIIENHTTAISQLWNVAEFHDDKASAMFLSEKAVKEADKGVMNQTKRMAIECHLTLSTHNGDKNRRTLFIFIFY